jgi:hypothetical protein
VRIAAHGIELDLPNGWEGRIYRVSGGDPILHAATFALPISDGDFGSGATAAMPAGGAFLALKEYRPGPRLRPEVGLFSASAMPLPLVAAHFHPRALQVGRPDQAGFQHFFTAARRPFCLYAVIELAGARLATTARTPARLGEVNGILSTLKIAGRA